MGTCSSATGRRPIQPKKILATRVLTDTANVLVDVTNYFHKTQNNAVAFLLTLLISYTLFVFGAVADGKISPARFEKSRVSNYGACKSAYGDYSVLCPDQDAVASISAEYGHNAWPYTLVIILSPVSVVAICAVIIFAFKEWKSRSIHGFMSTIAAITLTVSSVTSFEMGIIKLSDGSNTYPWLVVFGLSGGAFGLVCIYTLVMAVLHYMRPAPPPKRPQMVLAS